MNELHIGIAQIQDPTTRTILRRVCEHLDTLAGVRGVADRPPTLAYEGQQRRFAAGVVGPEGGLYEYRGGRWRFTQEDETARALATGARAGEVVTTIPASGMGHATAVGSSWPPEGPVSWTETLSGAPAYIRRGLVDTTYTHQITALRFDTSAIPAGSTVLEAWLGLPVSFATQGASGDMALAIDWHNAITCTAADYAFTPTGDALACLTRGLFTRAGWHLLPLANVARLQAGGISGVRLLHTDTAAPVDDDYVTLTPSQTAGYPALIVRYR